MTEFRRALALWLVLAVAGLAVFALSLALGSVRLDAAQWWAALTGADGSTAGAIVRELRLPRAIAAFACGGLLALSGALMQVLLRNPLAEPYVLGVSGGAATGALLAMLTMLPLWTVQVGAAGGRCVRWCWWPRLPGATCCIHRSRAAITKPARACC